MSNHPSPNEPVFLGGGSRPKRRSENFAGSQGSKKEKTDVQIGVKRTWMLKDLRKTRAPYYDEHRRESAIEILSHAVGGVSYRHYPLWVPLAFKAITTFPQPTAFSALARG